MHSYEFIVKINDISNQILQLWVASQQSSPSSRAKIHHPNDAKVTIRIRHATSAIALHAIIVEPVKANCIEGSWQQQTPFVVEGHP